jgi:TP901 family phage tail tape measure protein
VPFEQNDEFTASSSAAQNLVRRMQRAAARTEGYEKAAEEDRRIAARQKRDASEQARQGTAREDGGPLSKDEQGNLDVVNQKLAERIALENQIIQNQERIASYEKAAAQRATRTPRRATTAGTGDFLPAVSERETFARQGPVRFAPERPRYALGAGGGGGYQPPGAGARYFRQPEEPERPQRLLNAGPQPAGLLGQGNTQFHADYAKGYEEEARAARVAAASTTAFGSAQSGLGPLIEHNGEYMRAANLEFTRFGALSSEWIGAASRGATTMEELGRQTTATIGKFGGWLAAGGLVFAALDAVRAIGKGAIESSSGVNQLERVIKKPSSIDPQTLQRSFRKESEHFNLPIEDVSNAAYEVGKVFKTQDEALEASKAVLYSVKVGELDVATASRYLIAIINGFHLPANQLVGVFDMLNAAQNEFGITISDVEAGLAKASGSFNAATTKGSPIQKYHELLALITTAQKATGQTGQVVGTAIQRAPNFLRQQKNKDILKRYGINAGGDLNDVIVQGFEKSQTLSGHKIAELASAIFGPQYGARIGTPLFQQFDLYKKILTKTSPQAAKGSGEEELQTQLGSLSEKITRIKTDLEDLGSNLAESGFLNILGVGVESVTQMLGLVNSLLEVFNKLPTPVKDTVSALIEARVALAALRKFNVGDTLFQGKPAAQRFFNPPNASRIRLNELLLNEESVSREAGQGSGRRLRRINEQVPIREDQAARAAERTKTLAAAGAVEGDAVYDAAVSEQARIEQRLSILRTQQADEAERQLNLLIELNEIEATKLATSKATSEIQVERIAAESGRFVPNTVNKGKGLTATQMAEQVGYAPQEIGAVAVGRGGEAAKATAAAEATVAAAGETAATGTRLGSLAARGVAATSIATQTLAGAASGVKALAGGLLDFVGGPVGIAFTALIFSPEIIGAFKSVSSWAEENLYGIHAAEDEATAKLGAKHFTRKELSTYRGEEEEREAAVNRAARKGGNFHDLAVAAEEHPVNAPKGFGVYADAYRKLEDAQAKALAERGQAQFLPSDVLAHQLGVVQELKPSGSHYQKALKDLKHNVKFGDLGDKERKALLAELQTLEAEGLNASGDITTFYKNFNAIANKLLEARVQALGTLVGAGPAFATQKDVHQYTNISVLGALRDFGSGKVGVREKGVGLVESLVETLDQNTQNELQENLSLATSQRARYAAYQKFFDRQRKNADSLRQNLNGRQQELHSKLSETEGNIGKLTDEGRGQNLSGQTIHGHNLGPNGNDKDIKLLEDLRQKRKEIERQLREAGKSQQFIERKLALLNQEQAQALLSERLGVIGEHGQIAEAKIGGEHPVAQARAGLEAAQREARLVKATKAASPEQARAAVLAVLQAREALDSAVKQETENLTGAAETLAQARANGNPLLEGKAELTKAQADLAVAKTPADRDNALAGIINARHKLEQDQAEILIGGIELESVQSQNPVTQARDAIRIAREKLSTAHGQAAKQGALKELVEARHQYEEDQVAVALSVIELEEAQTENPVKQAADRVRAARVGLKQSKGKGAAAENQAKAQLVEAKRNRQEAAASYAIENVEFDAAVGKLTTDQEIAAYTRLLHTLKLGRDAKRNLIEKIHSLQEEASGSLELTVGNIALPTLYDIKRAVQGGISGGTAAAGSYNDYSTQSNTYHIHGDQKEIERALDNTLNRNTKSSKKSAGVS